MLGIGIGSGTLPGTVTSTGFGTPFTTYNGLALAGQGVPPIVGVANLSAQGFAVFNTATPVTLVAAGAGNAGTYRVSVNLIITTTFVTNTQVQIQVKATDDAALQTFTTITTSITAGAAGSDVQSTTFFRSTGATAVTYTPSVTGTAATAGVASFSVVVERLI